ncbi:DUF3570 domain-containing protein [uncultured Piscinibacter sp.]|uniref:DUF3570 domain-containing protein n=1 Tax=uncultured Piscinibacter sp. TaxID=1131835 RepID=UPI002639F5B5|nr:DUF3570 domain-containing protein [uncultured Piscinibacter sp.]
MAATEGRLSRLPGLLQRLVGLLGSLLAVGGAKAIELPENRAEALYHLYKGGGVTADGPALLVRKSLADKVSLSGSYYVDAVSNASIDVVTTASPFKEKRTAYDLGVDYAHRDSLMSLSVYRSKEPDYVAESFSVDVAQEVFGNMTTVALGYTRSVDEVSRNGDPTFADTAKHWQYRLGLTQVLTPSMLASANLEVVSDSGYLGNPYRAAVVFGATVPERMPRTRTSRALKLRVVGDLGDRNAARAEYRYFWDTWDIKAHTLEAGYSRYVGSDWLADGFTRFYSQSEALFYSDNATTETTYVSRNRQLSAFRSLGLGGKLSYVAKRVPGQYELKIVGSYERIRFNYKNFTDIRNGQAYDFDANLLQLYVTATF